MSRVNDLFNSRFGRFIIGIIKTLLAGFLTQIVASLSHIQVNTNIHGYQIPVSTIIQVIAAFFPVLLLLSAMQDLLGE